jgi:hypothetical protein
VGNGLPVAKAVVAKDKLLAAMRKVAVMRAERRPAAASKHRLPRPSNRSSRAFTWL